MDPNINLRLVALSVGSRPERQLPRRHNLARRCRLSGLESPCGYPVLLAIERELSAALWARGKGVAVPTTADCLDEKYRACLPPPKNVHCSQFIAESGVLGGNHLEIARHAPFISTVRKIERALRGFDGSSLYSCFLFQ